MTDGLQASLPQGLANQNAINCLIIGNHVGGAGATPQSIPALRGIQMSRGPQAKGTGEISSELQGETQTLVKVEIKKDPG